MPSLRVSDGMVQALAGLGKNRDFGLLSEKPVTKCTRQALPTVQPCCDNRDATYGCRAPDLFSSRKRRHKSCVSALSKGQERAARTVQQHGWLSWGQFGVTDR
jgi:hypothetical protein